MNDYVFGPLWEQVKLKARTLPYAFGSKYYAHREAAEKVAQDNLAPELHADFKKYVMERIKGYSNYAGD